MNAPNLSIKSVTGVDVELQIAGPGSRSYAFLIDWHIRLLLGVLWYIVATFASGSVLGARLTGGSAVITTVAPALIIYFFYHPVLELAMRGRTPGKRMAGVRLVTRDGEIPSFGAILLRNVFRLLDAAPAFYVVGLMCVIFTRQHVRVGDLASGTLLVIDAADAERSLAVLGSSAGVGRLNPQVVELVHELLERWNSLDEGTRVNLARSLLAKIEPQAATGDGPVSSGGLELHARLQTVLRGGAA